MRLPYADTQCGAKVLRREVVEDVLPHLSSRDLLFDVDLLAAAGERGWRIVEVPTVWIDQEGSRVRPVADTRRMGVSLVRLWARRRRGAAARTIAPPPHAGAFAVAEERFDREAACRGLTSPS